MADIITKKSPIDAFTEYFLEVKPYHAKILEIVEKYNFYDNIVVDFSDKLSTKYDLANTPLCKPVGFGLEWDEECGFDATECCSLGTCPTTATSFTNLTPTISSSIQQIIAGSGNVIVSGNVTYDKTFQIKKILTQNTFSIGGDQTSLLNIENIFTIIPFNTIKYTINAVNSIVITGNYAKQFTDKRTFEIYGSNYNDGVYNVSSAAYSQFLNQTTIIVVESMIVSDVGNILIESSTKNNGIFSALSWVYNGADTIVTIDTTVKKMTVENAPTSIIFKTGFKETRIASIIGNSSENDGSYVVVSSSYDPITSTTNVSISNLLGVDVLCTTNNCGKLWLQLDMSIAGYLASQKCNPPQENNISVNFAERLVLNGGFRPTITPTPTMTPTPSTSATITPTPTMTITPTLTATITPTITSTITPTHTPPVTVTITPTMTGTPAVTQTITPTATITPPVTITPTPTPSAYPPLSYYIVDGDPRSAVYMQNFGTTGSIVIDATAYEGSGAYKGAPFAVDPSSTNVINCGYVTNGTYTPSSRPPQYEDSNSHTNMPLIFPTGGSGNYSVTVSNLAVQCQKQSYAIGPPAIGIVQSTANAKTTISTYCGNAIMCNNTGSAWVSGPAKNLLLNTYYNGFGPIFGMAACSSSNAYQLAASFTVTITDNVTGLTLTIPGSLAMDRSVDGSQGVYNPCG